MRDGADRSDVPYLWPSTLHQPARPPALVYLDLNHWISLAKAFSGHAEGTRFAGTFDSCLAAREQRRAVFPISDAIYIEVGKIGQHRQRRHLRETIEALSGYVIATARPVIATHEIEAMLDQAVGPSRNPINKMDYLDWGVARAFGKVGGFRVRGPDGTDVTEEARASWKDGPEALDRFLADAELELQRRVLEGPTPDEEPELQRLGWDPTGTMAIAENRATQEVEQVARFDEDPRWRRGRIRDVVAAREVYIEINEALFDGMANRDGTLDSVFTDPETTRRHVDSMPSFDVAVTLKTAYHRDASHRWTPNDVHDIDALGSTLPYCDIVVTDKAAAAQATQSGLADRLGTVVLSRLEDLPSHLGARGHDSPEARRPVARSMR